MSKTNSQHLWMAVVSGLLVLSSTLTGGCVLNASPEGCAEAEDVSVDEAYGLIQQNAGDADFVILDVRTPAEFAAERIAGAVNLDVESDTDAFRSDVAKLDRNKTYLIYCRSARRSCIAAGIMEELGFTTRYNMEGGINAWKAAQYPLTQ